MQKIFSLRIIWGVILAVCALGIGIDVMEIDAAQYASISREMYETGNYLQIHDLHADYLDKPPLLFWFNSLSIALFGANNFAVRLPALLGGVLAVWSVFGFAKIFYSRNVAYWAALMLGASQAMILITHDVRCDTLLMAFTALAFWQLAEGFEGRKKWFNFLLGFTGVALAMLAKGPVALVLTALAFGFHFAVRRDWRQFLRSEYLWGIAWVLLLLAPMTWGLYQQFDLHPGKLIEKVPIQSGVRFFYWTQSFGRITGESVWNNGAGFGFLFQNMLWAWLPWIVFFVPALFDALRKVALPLFGKNNISTASRPEFISTGAFVLGYLAMGSSRYQLPHYIFITFPMVAVLTARWCAQVAPQMAKKWHWSFGILIGLQWVVVVGLWVAAFLLCIITFPSAFWVGYLVLSLLAFVVFFWRKGRTFEGLKWASVATILSVNVVMNGHFYPTLLTYQASSNLGHWLYARPELAQKVVAYEYSLLNAVSFYANRYIPSQSDIQQLRSGAVVITSFDGIRYLNEAKKEYEILYQNKCYHISLLTPAFLNPARREKTLMAYYVLRLK